VVHSVPDPNRAYYRYYLFSTFKLKYYEKHISGEQKTKHWRLARQEDNKNNTP
jgi:hypothetical protein